MWQRRQMLLFLFQIETGQHKPTCSPALSYKEANNKDSVLFAQSLLIYLNSPPTISPTTSPIMEAVSSVLSAFQPPLPPELGIYLVRVPARFEIGIV